MIVRKGKKAIPLSHYSIVPEIETPRALDAETKYKVAIFDFIHAGIWAESCLIVTLIPSILHVGTEQNWRKTMYGLLLIPHLLILVIVNLRPNLVRGIVVEHVCRSSLSACNRVYLVILQCNRVKQHWPLNPRQNTLWAPWWPLYPNSNLGFPNFATTYTLLQLI